MGNRFALLILIFLLLAVPPVSAQLMQHIQSGIEEVARGMDYVGQRAGSLLGGKDAAPSPEGASSAVRREFEQQYPLGPAPMLFLSNEFGEIRVTSWDERLIRVKAAILVSAPSQSVAEQLSQLIELRIEQGGDYWECRTHLPEVQGGETVSMTVNYEVTVPKDAGLVVENYFGDVFVDGLGGSLSAEVQYGGLQLSQVNGPVRARVQGEFPVSATGLNQGGVFKLVGATAEFSNYQGDLDINQFRGSVTVRRPGQQSALTLSSDNGRAEILLPPDANPDLTATLEHGRFESELDVKRALRGKQLLARHPNAESEQHITINASFSEVLIGIEGGMSQAVSRMNAEQKAFTDTSTSHIPTGADNTMSIEAMPGNIHIEGVDEDRVTIEMTRVAWTPSAAAAMDALDALEMQAETKGTFIRLKTRVTQDMTAFSCQSYRVDLRIKCPRTLPITLVAEEGSTVVEGLGAGCTLLQNTGEISLKHVRGALSVTANNGSVKIQACTGPAEVTTRLGDVTVGEMFDALKIDSAEGKVFVDAPGGAVQVRQKKGDVHLLSLNPLPGNVDIFAETGDVNVFISPESSAAITVKTQGGQVRSALSLSGSINRESQEFFGRLNSGANTLLLETINGNVYLN